MHALRNIFKNNRLHFNEKTIEERRSKHERSVNPVKAFIEALLTQGDTTEDDNITKEDFYNAFKRYCNRYKIAQ